MAAVLMYTTAQCPYCVRAEQLLRELAAEEQKAVSPKRSSFFSRLSEYFQPKDPVPEREEKP